jgi:hypothetical protein
MSLGQADVTGQGTALLTKLINNAAGDLSAPGFDRLHRAILKVLSCRFSHRPHNAAASAAAVRTKLFGFSQNRSRAAVGPEAVC